MLKFIITSNSAMLGFFFSSLSPYAPRFAIIFDVRKTSLLSWLDENSCQHVIKNTSATSVC